MINSIFNGLFDLEGASVIAVEDFLLCLAFSLVAGIVLALAYTFKNRYTKSFILTLALLPAVVCVVIMMVNGNIGAGVAVAGAFSLVRFRSAPGSAKEIVMIFLAMGAGLIIGMGYIAYAMLFTVLMSLIFTVYNYLTIKTKNIDLYKTLKVVIPEDLNYTEVFSDILDKYTKECELISVKTTNLGSMYKLTYEVKLKDPKLEKEFIDNLRMRNGNLEIIICRLENIVTEL